jgi:hypothetical protein
MSKNCLKHVEAFSRNELKVSSKFCYAYYTDFFAFIAVRGTVFTKGRQ